MTESIHAQFEQTIVLPKLATDKLEPNLSLRPVRFEDYPGQERICENLKIYTQAAKMRGKILDHCLFYGPPGLGKTTLAGIIAAEMGYNFKITSGPVLEKAADLMGILANIEPNSILFIDEIHRLSPNIEELLYSAMEDMRLDILVGAGHGARTVKFELAPFCLIGATTRAGSISAPLRDRFGIQERLDFYSTESLIQILRRSSKIMGSEISVQAATELARRSRGTPRIANQLLRRVLDFALVQGQNLSDSALVHEYLCRLGVDEEGLSKMDRDFLWILLERYEGGPAGLESIAAAMNEDKNTLEDVYEPYLVHKGFVLRTSRGRVLSESGEAHIKKNFKK